MVAGDEVVELEVVVVAVVDVADVLLVTFEEEEDVGVVVF